MNAVDAGFDGKRVGMNHVSLGEAIMKSRLSIFLSVIGFLLLLVSCGGGGGGDSGGGGSAAPPADVAGEWTITEKSKPNTCGAVADPPYKITIAQSGTSITVTTASGKFSGNLNGNTLSWSGSYPEDGGTTTITSLTATVTGNTLSGNSQWTWADPPDSCRGSTSFTGKFIEGTKPAKVTVGGTITGLSGTVVLRNNDGDNLTRNASGAFTFATAINAGSAYTVTVFTQPNGQTCSVANGIGVAKSNVTDIAVKCSAASYSLSTATVGSGSIVRNPNQTNYGAGTQVQLTAVPQPGNAFGFWSGGLAGSQNPTTVLIDRNLSITANFSVTTASLTVSKAGLGSGTVTGTGINCGTDCAESFGLEQQAVLTATAATGSSFDSWSGCDSTNANQCTVTMSNNRAVTATFLGLGFTQIPLNVAVASTDSDGTYDVTVTEGAGMLGASSFVLQEASSLAFSNPIPTSYTTSDFPRRIQFVNKPDGTYCYRATFAGGLNVWGTADCVTVSRPASAVLRISNQSNYDLVDVRLNSAQKANYPYVILAGDSADFVFSSGGNVAYNLGNGFYKSDGSRDVWFTLKGQLTLTAGQTSTITFNNPTIGQLLSDLSDVSTANDWDGAYFSSLNQYYKRFRFTSAGGWQLFDSTAPCLSGATCAFSQVGTGTVRLISWPRYSSIVTFDFGPGTPAATLSYPSGSFLYRNGPTSWPIIEYEMQ